MQFESHTFPCAQCGKDVPVAKLLDGQTHVFCTPPCFREYKRNSPMQELKYYHRKAMDSYFPAKKKRRGHHSHDTKYFEPAAMTAEWASYYSRMSHDNFRISQTKETSFFKLNKN